MSRNRFRLLVAAGWFFSILGLPVMEIEKRRLPPEVQDYFRSLSEVWWGGGTHLHTWVLFAAFIVTSLGLLWFRRWARSLFVFSYAASILLLPTLPPTVVTPWASLLSGLSWVAFSTTVALMYLPPVKEYFNRTQADFS